MLPEGKRLKTKEDLRRYLEIEKKNYNIIGLGGGGWIAGLFMFREYDILYRHSVLLRKTEYYVNNKKKVLSLYYKMRLYHLQNKYSIHIPINCFEEGLKIMHVGPVLVNPNVSVGKNCSLHVNTGIVAQGRNNGVPILGDGVVIGMGAVCLGEIYISDNVAIGANAVVNKSIEQANVAVAGCPAKIVSRHGRMEWSKSD